MNRFHPSCAPVNRPVLVRLVGGPHSGADVAAVLAPDGRWFSYPSVRILKRAVKDWRPVVASEAGPAGVSSSSQTAGRFVRPAFLGAGSASVPTESGSGRMSRRGRDRGCLVTKHETYRQSGLTSRTGGFFVREAAHG